MKNVLHFLRSYHSAITRVLLSCNCPLSVGVDFSTLFKTLITYSACGPYRFAHVPDHVFSFRTSMEGPLALQPFYNV